MKIAYVWQRQENDLDKISAPVLHVRAVVDRLRQRGYQVRMISFKDGRPAWSDSWHTWQEASPRHTSQNWFRLPERVTRGVQSRLNLPYAGLFESARFADTMLPALRDCDLIYERHDLLASAGVMAGRHLGIPVVLEVNGDLIEEWGEQGIVLSRAQSWTVRQITRRAFHAASHTVAVSEALRQSTITRWGLEPSKVSTVLNGADIETLASSNGAVELPFDWRVDGRPIVIHVGNFYPWHSLDLLVEAFARLRNRTDARLMLVGDGPLRENIEALVDRLDLRDSIILTGLVPHTSVGALLKQAEVAVMAHRPTTAAASGTPLKLLEYMAAGKAIVAPRLRNIEAIVQDGKSALFFEPGNADSLATVLMKVLADPLLRRSLGKTAHAEAVANHSWENTVQKLEQIFRSLVESDRLYEDS